MQNESVAQLQAMLQAKDYELASLTEKYAQIHARLERVSRVLQETAPNASNDEHS
jgi:hypothetical protein